MRPRSHPHARNPRRRGFTMIEMLTIIVIIGALASVVVPVFQDSTIDAKDAILMHNLKHIRMQVERYRVDHHGAPPGQNGWHPSLQMLFYTNANGEISLTKAPEYPYGPYISVHGVTNPINGGIAVVLSADPAHETPNDALLLDDAPVGWFYDTVTGRIVPNAEGTTSNGTPRTQL